VCDFLIKRRRVIIIWYSNGRIISLFSINATPKSLQKVRGKNKCKVKDEGIIALTNFKETLTIYGRIHTH
jgi:hypothetical protein